MNENKTTLILKIARELTDDQCGMILQRIESNQYLLANKLVRLANQWVESKHPRSKDGRFTDGFGQIGSQIDKDVKKWFQDFPKTPLGERLQRIAEHLPSWMTDDGRDEKPQSKTPSRKGGKGQNIVEICQEFLDKAKADGDEESFKEWTEKLEQAKELLSGRTKRKRKTTKDLVRRFQEVEDEMDEIEEAYGDRDKGVGFKWPETQEADEARKRYRKLVRERSKLDKQIDWKSYMPDDTVDDPPENHPEDAGRK